METPRLISWTMGTKLISPTNFRTLYKIMHMINIERIEWMYENFGFAAAIRSACIDIVALLGFMGYYLTLPFQFLLIILRGKGKD